MKFRDYQLEIINKGSSIIKTKGFLYLAMEVRTGKTLTSLGILNELNAEKVLFVTKKKAISSIEDDYALYNPSFNLTVINYESLHKLNQFQRFDGIVLDEAHGLGKFPKPSKRAKDIKNLLSLINTLMLF